MRTGSALPHYFSLTHTLLHVLIHKYKIQVISDEDIANILLATVLLIIEAV